MSQQINLFNPAFLKRKQYFTATMMAQGLAAILAGVLMLAFYGQRRVAALEQQAKAGQATLEAREARKAKMAAELVPRKKSPDLALEIEKAEADQRSLREVTAILQRGEFGNTRGYSGYFRAFAHSRVNGLWLTEVTIAGAGHEIGLRGRALEPRLVPAYINGLTREPVLQGASFARLDIAVADSKPERTTGPAAGIPAAPAVPAAYHEFSLQSTPAQAAGAKGATVQ